MSERTRLQNWSFRMAPIHGLGEMWRSELPHPAAEKLAQRGADPRFYLTSNLLRNVVQAAGGIEYSVRKLLEALDADQAWAVEHAPPDGPEGGPAHGFAGPSRDVIQFELVNLFFWLKVMDGRIRSRLDDTIGLLPALAPDEPWTQTVRDLYGALHQRALADSALANFATHVEPLPNTFGSNELKEGRLVVAVPDTPGERRYHWTELTFERERDARGLAAAVLSAVEEFVDKLLTVFEDAEREIRKRRDSAAAKS